MSRVTDETQPLPCLGTKAMWKPVERGIRQWLICNGMNAGRWTLHFGPHCLSDTEDTESIRVANQSDECVVEEFNITPVVKVTTDPPKPYYLRVETDDDFPLSFEGVLYSSREFELELSSLQQLKEIEVLGPYGTERTENTKCNEWELAVAQILKSPGSEFDSTGGNRGVEYRVLD